MTAQPSGNLPSVIAREQVSIVEHLFSAETFLAAFLFAGRFKTDPRLSRLPVDLTLLLFVLSVFTGIIALFRLKSRNTVRARKLLGPGLLFAAYALLSLWWSPGHDYARTKALYLSTLCLWPLLVSCLVVAADRLRFRRFLLAFLVFSLWLAVESIRAFVHGGAGSFIHVLGGGYLGLGRMIGMGAVILYGYGIDRKRSWLSRVPVWAGFAMMAALQLVIGSRGSLMATLLALTVPVILGFRVRSTGIGATRYGRGALAVCAIVLVLMFYLFLSKSELITLERLRLLVTHDVGVSARTRLEHYAVASSLWTERPILGYGLGAYPIVAGMPDIKYHPHNILLEILVELGLVGLLLWCLFFLTGLLMVGSLRRAQHDELLLIAVMLVLHALAYAMVSDDIAENRILWCAIGLLCVRPGKQCA